MMASLYDDIEVTKGGGASKWTSPAPPSSSLSMMQSHMAARKQTTQARSAAAATRTAKTSGPTLAPVLDLGRSSSSVSTSVEGEYRFNQHTGRLEKVSTITASPFIGDPTLSLGVTDEYNPLYPNDYEDVSKRLKEERRARSRQQPPEEPAETRQLVPRRYDSASDEEDDDEEQERRIEERKRRPGGGGGAAIAPPPSLVEEPPPPPPALTLPPKDSTSASVTASLYGINSVAAKMMAKMGYREGQGLGREGQGMSTALVVEKTSRRGGKIIHERDERQNPTASSGNVPRADVGNMDHIMRKPSKVVLLRNMVGSGEVDDDLQPETAEECSKYGPVANVMIFELPDSTEEEAVRIFVEFETVDAATQAILDLNGRFFGGRVVKATFYDLDRFINLELGDEVVD